MFQICARFLLRFGNESTKKFADLLFRTGLSVRMCLVVCHDHPALCLFGQVSPCSLKVLMSCCAIFASPSSTEMISGFKSTQSG